MNSKLQSLRIRICEMKNSPSGNELVDSLETICIGSRDSEPLPASLQPPVRMGWLRKHRWHLPSRIESPSIKTEHGRVLRRPGSTTKVVRWLMQRSRSRRGNSEFAPLSEGKRPSAWCDKHKPVLSAEGLQLFILCYVAYTLLYFTRKPFSVVKEEMRANLGVSTFVLGWIDTAFLGCYAGGQLLMPLCIAKLSAQQLNLLLVGCFFSSFAAGIVFGCSSSPIWFIAAWGLNGLVHSPAFPILIKILSVEVPPVARGSVMGIWTTSQQLGGITATTFCSLMDWGHGWRWVFWSSACLCFLGGLILRLLLPKFASNPSTGSLAMKEKGGSANLAQIRVEGTTMGSKTFAPAGLAVNGCSCGEQLSCSSPKNSFELEGFGSKRETQDSVSCDTQEFGESVRSPLPQGLNTKGIEKPLDTFPIDSTPWHWPKNAAYNSSCDTQWKGVPPCPDRTKLQPLKTDDILPDVLASSSPEESGEELFSTGKGYGRGTPQSQELPFRLSGIILLCSCSYFFVKFVRYTLAFWLPFFLCRHGNLSVTSAGLSSMSFDVGGIFGAVLGGVVADKLLGGRRLSLAALMCIATGICLLLVALSCQQLEHLRLSGEGLLLEGQLALQSLQRTLQENWSRLDDDSRRGTKELLPEMQHLLETNELAREQAQQQGMHKRRPTLIDAQPEDFDLLQEMQEVHSWNQTHMSNDSAKPGTTSQIEDTELKAGMGEASAPRTLLSLAAGGTRGPIQDEIEVSGSPIQATEPASPAAAGMLYRLSSSDSWQHQEEEKAFRGFSEALESDPGFRQNFDGAPSDYEQKSNAVLRGDPLDSTSVYHHSAYSKVERIDSEQEERIAVLQRDHNERMALLKSEFEAKEKRVKEESAWQLMQLLGYMLLVGFFNSIPDSVLGASAAQDLLELPGAVQSNVAAVASFINAIGALGALLQGMCTAAISEIFGWDVLFGVLCLLSIFSAILLLPVALREGTKG